MKCVPGVSSRVGYECQVCHRMMGLDDSRDCFPVEIEKAPISVEAEGCCNPPVAAALPLRLCVPTEIQDCKDADFHRCVKCGYLFVPGEQRERPCDNPDSQKQPIPLPPWIASAAKYVNAYIAYVAKGRPVLSFPEIMQRFRVCSSCPFYADATGQCSICGCFVNLLHKGQGINKLEWASETCPHKPPKWNKQTT